MHSDCRKEEGRATSLRKANKDETINQINDINMA